MDDASQANREGPSSSLFPRHSPLTTHHSPLILSTWRFGQKACEAGWPYLVGDTPSSLDAVEQACRAVEADPEIMTVGYGGRPDRSGEVTLDAAIMLAPDRCGAVCCLRRFIHPTTIARWVMEKSPHVMLAGEGAERFAAGQGMEPADLLSDAARAAWEKWLEEHPDADGLPADQAHDTVGVLAQDASGRLAGACSTSGLPFKLPGRVGDSPIIGHGLYVDPSCGAAVATGWGELIMGVCATFLAVESMRRGATPSEAAIEVIERIVATQELDDQHQAAIITLTTSGAWGSAALRPGYRTAVQTASGLELVDPDRVMLP
jgi:N4-(beta-N-acetylglucosaminyl)-L-asparaginase